MRSVEVVFPASMCAMMPMLRVSASCALRAISLVTAAFSPEPSRPARFLYRVTATTEVRFRRRPNGLPRVNLPAIMHEGLIGLGHAVYVVLFLHRAAARVGRIH